MHKLGGAGACVLFFTLSTSYCSLPLEPRLGLADVEETYWLLGIWIQVRAPRPRGLLGCCFCPSGNGGLRASVDNIVIATSSYLHVQIFILNYTIFVFL
jgi:hypothetical protein